MGSGIHLAIPVAPRAPWEDAAPGISAAPTSPPVAECPAAAGIVLVETGQSPAGAALPPVPLSPGRISPAPGSDLSLAHDSGRPQAHLVARASVQWEPSAAEGSAAQVGAVTALAASAVLASAGEEASGGATDGVAAFSVSAGASASAGPIGAAAGRSAGTPGGITLTGMPLGHTRITRTTRTRDTTIRRLTTTPITTIPMLRMTPTRGQTT
jgi:hypothetical protein